MSKLTIINKPKKEYWRHRKHFGRHVIGFYGRVNGGPTRPMISVNCDEPIDDPCFGEWLTLAQAERLQNQLYLAIVHMKEHRSRSKGK